MDFLKVVWAVEEVEEIKEVEEGEEETKLEVSQRNTRVLYATVAKGKDTLPISARRINVWTLNVKLDD